MTGGAYGETEVTENMVERRLGYTFLRDWDQCGRLLVGIGDRCSRHDDGEDTVLHVCDNLLDLSSLLEASREDKAGKRTVVSFGTAIVR